MFLAHGVHSRADLPVSATLAVVGAGLVLVISFVALAMMWRRPKCTGGKGGWPLSTRMQAAVDAPALRIALQAVSLAAMVLVCVVGLAGPPATDHNVAPWAFYIIFWVGLIPTSLLLGPIWRVLNPLRLTHAVLAAALRLHPAQGALKLPDRVGYWPAALSLAVFAWGELVYPNGSDPAFVAVFVVSYAVVHTVAALLVGHRWFSRGDGFEVYSALLGAMAPLGRRTDGRLVRRNPLEGLDAIQPVAGLVGVVVTLVGSTAYDGLSHTSWWNWHMPPGMVAATLELVATILLIGLIYLLGTWILVGSDHQLGDAPNAAAFAHSIVPITAGYAVAHYFSALFFDSQQALILASDPFGRGWNLFGAAHHVINYNVIAIRTIALVQIGAIVTGHLLAAVSAHERAVQLFPPRLARSVQYPLLAAMVGLTTGAVGLMFAS